MIEVNGTETPIAIIGLPLAVELFISFDFRRVVVKRCNLRCCAKTIATSTWIM